MICFILSLLFVLGLAQVSAVMRITKSKTPEARCLSRAVPAGKCERKRRKALEKGCINKEEYNTLKRCNSFLSYDPDEIGLL